MINKMLRAFGHVFYTEETDRYKLLALALLSRPDNMNKIKISQI